MRVSVVDLAPPGGRHVSVYEGPCDECPYESVLYIPVPATIPVSELTTAVHELHSTLRRDADLIVLRLHSPHADDLLADETQRRLVSMRLERRSVAVLHWADSAHTFTSLTEATPAIEGAAQLWAALRHAEFESLLSQPGVVLPQVSSLHYEAPNGKHYRSFVRVGTAIQSVEAIDGIAFWLLPLLRDRPVVLLDSWTIISLGLNITRYVDQAGLDDAGASAVECQRSYGEHHGPLIPRLERVCARVGRDKVPPALVVVSVSSSGTLARELVEACHRSGFEDAQVVSLYAPDREVADEVFCTYAGSAEYFAPSECPHCVLGTSQYSPSVRIEPTTYLLELSATVERTRITVVNALPSKNFFDLYKGAGCFSIHRDQHDGARHHMIHVDAERLTANATFKQRLADCLAKMPTVDVVLAPRHSAATDLARLVTSKLGHDDPVIADPDSLSELPGEVQERLRSAERILLVDDVVVTGSRLRSYRNLLREGGFLGHEHPNKLHFLVAVARPPHADVIESVNNMVHGEDQYWEVERLLLPNWDKQRCPWCWEADLLDSVREQIAGNPVLAARLDTLLRTDHGLRDELFLRWSTEPEQTPIGLFELGPGSIFTASDQVELFVGVASAMQNLRSVSKLMERFTTPLARVLQPEFVENRYYDPGIYVSVLRAAQRHDLRAVNVEEDLSQMLRRRLTNRHDVGLRAEILLAMSRGVLPVLPEVLAEDGVLAETSGTPEVRALLTAALGTGSAA